VCYNNNMTASTASPYTHIIDAHEGIGDPFRATFDYHGATRTVVNCVFKVTSEAHLILVGFEVKRDGSPSLTVKAYRWDEVSKLRFARG
jgi:hypothetical protein